MARQRRPDKSPAVEQPTPLHRVARIVSDWKIIITVVVLFGGGIAFALSYKFATKAELMPLIEHVARHDIDNARMDQKLDDVVDTVHQIRDQLSRLK